MFQFLDSLLTEIGDPDREDLLSVVVPRLHARIRELPKCEQLALRDEITEIRQTLVPATPAWSSHQLIFQYLWHLNHVDAEWNGDWYARGTWLTPEEVGQRIRQRTAP